MITKSIINKGRKALFLLYPIQCKNKWMVRTDDVLELIVVSYLAHQLLKQKTWKNVSRGSLLLQKRRGKKKYS
jgi:hypothetical protein